MIGKRYTEKEVAEHFRVTMRTLQRWRQAGEGPDFIVVGKNSVLYREEDIAAYEQGSVRGGVIPPPALRTMVRAAEAFDTILGWKKLPEKTAATLANLRDELRAQLKQEA